MEAVAICFRRTSTPRKNAQDLVWRKPEAFVTTSARVAPQFREFERFTTAAMNAFIGPKVRNYVRRFEDRLKQAGIAGDLHIMGSNGGVATRPWWRTCRSDADVGTAAACSAAAWRGASGRPAHHFDVGGTRRDMAS